MASRFRWLGVVAVWLGAGCLVGTLNTPRPVPTSSRPTCALDAKSKTARCPCTTKSDLAALPDSADLERLTLTPVEPVDLAALSRLHHLRALVLDIAIEPPMTLAGLDGVRTLRELVIDIRGVDITPLAGLKNLEKLTIACHPCKSLDALRELSSLRELAIEGEVVERAAHHDDEEIDVDGHRFAQVTTDPTIEALRARGVKVVATDGGPGEGICKIDPTGCQDALALCREAMKPKEVYTLD